MKLVTIALIILSLMPTVSVASGFQIGAGGLTSHYGVGPGYRNYCEQIGKSDVIYNRTYYLRAEGQRNVFTYMAGYDSICSPVQGAFYTYKIFEGKWLVFGITAGGYRFKMANWTNEENHSPINKIKVTPVYTVIGKDIFIVPVLAAEMDVAVVHAGTWGIWLNALITPIISNLSLSLKKTF